MELNGFSWLALVCIICWLSYYYVLAGRKRCNINGPSFLTVLSHLHLFGTVNFPKVLTKWAKQYGDIYSYSTFGKRFVVVSTPETIKSVYNVEERTQNVPLNAFEIATQGHFGIGSTEFKDNFEQRKFTVQALKQYGFRGIGLGSNNEQISNYMDDFITNISKHCNEPVDPEILQLPALNIMWGLTTSTFLAEDQIPLLSRFQKSFGTYLWSNAQNIFGPLHAFLGFESEILKKLKETTAEFHEVQQEIIDAHEKNLENQSEPEDFVDAYLLKIKEGKMDEKSFRPDVGIKNLRGALMDMNLGGSNTVAHTFLFTILYIIIHPEVQAKLRKQIDAVIGPNRAPVLEDRKDIPYAEAVILEVLRYIPTVPFTFRESAEDTKMEGYFIPKNSTILGNFWGSNHDERLWEDPTSFKPERFIDASGKKIQKAELVMTFGAGRRKCPGYMIGQDILFLLLARIVQRFNLKQHPDHPITSLEPNLGFFLTPPDFKILFEDRLSSSS